MAPADLYCPYLLDRMFHDVTDDLYLSVLTQSQDSADGLPLN